MRTSQKELRLAQPHDVQVRHGSDFIQMHILHSGGATFDFQEKTWLAMTPQTIC